MNKLNSLIYWLFKAKPSGLLPLPKDSRDLQLGSIFDLFGYTTKNKIVDLKPLTIYNQFDKYNCSFMAHAGNKSIQEQVILSPRYLHAKAWQLGLCQKNGLASLRAGAEVLKKFGCAEEKDCPSDKNLPLDEWLNINFNWLDKLAVKHKIKSYWFITNKDQYLKAIDEGFAVTLGRDWYTSMNMGGGLVAPWIIKKLGYKVGGHATDGVGHNQDYYLNKVSTEANSYGYGWGDNGKFYCPLDDLDKDIKQYGAIAYLDLDYDKVITAEDIKTIYEGKNIRGDKSGAIYLIYQGFKAPYKDAEAFVAYNGFSYTQPGAFTVVPQAEIDKVELLDPNEPYLTAESGRYAEVVKNMKRPVNSNFDSNKEVNN